MKILLLGGTGRTGRLFLKYALERGYRVNCLSRNSGRINKTVGLEVFEGNPIDKTDLRRALWGCDYVVSFFEYFKELRFSLGAANNTTKLYVRCDEGIGTNRTRDENKANRGLFSMGGF